MGIDVNKDNKLILKKLDDLIEKINWYKDYIKSDFDMPLDLSIFSERNIDLINNVETLTNIFKEYKNSTENGNFSYSPEQKMFKNLQIAVMLKYLGFY